MQESLIVRYSRDKDEDEAVAIHDITDRQERLPRMALIHTCRAAARTGRVRFVPGGLACAAAARQLLFSPTPLRISSTLKFAPGFSHKSVRLAPNPA